MTAMDEWAKQQQGDGESQGEGEQPHTGDQLSGADDADVMHDDAVDANESAEDSALAAKKATDKKIFILAGSAAALIGVVTVGLSVFGGGTRVARAPSAIPTTRPAPIAQAVESSQVIAPMAPATTAAAPLDFGLPQPTSIAAPTQDFAAPQASPGSSETPAAVPALAAPTPVTAAPAAAVPAQLADAGPGAPAVPATQSSPAPANSSPIGAPSSAESAAELDVARKEIERLQKLVGANEKDIEALRADVRELEALRKDVKALRLRVAKAEKPRPAPSPRPAAQKKSDEPRRTAAKFEGITEYKEPYAPVKSPVLSQTKATPSAPPAFEKGGKVRADFTVYAISNGRAWVHWKGDGENHMVGLNSVLPDNSRVTKIDDVNGIVFSTTGEIHPKPSR